SVAGEKLEAAAITSTNTLTQIAPGLNFVAQGTVGQPNVRGVGSTNSANGDEANVSMYVDGVYQPDMFASIFQLANIQRVEVLKGPQGTLFGRNSTGGSINILTRTPSFAPSAEVT